MPKVVIDKERCKGCELCVTACPKNILAMSEDLNEKGYFYAKVIDQPACILCHFCAISCPDTAIEVFDEKAEAEPVKK